MRLLASQPPVLWALALFFLGLGFTSRFDIPLAVLALTAAVAFNSHSTYSHTGFLRQHAVVLAFLFAAGLATLMSVNPGRSLSVQPQLLPALLCYAVIVTFITGQENLRFIFVALLASGILTATLTLQGVASTSVSADALAHVKAIGNALLIVPNDLLMLAVMAPLVTAVAWTGGVCLRLLAGLYLLLALVTGVILQSRQSVILLISGQVLLVLLLKPRWSIPLLVAGLALGLLVDWLLGWPLASKILMFPRAYVWRSAWLMFLDSPVTGQGPGMFKDLYFQFLERAGYELSELGDRRTMPWAHSLYLEQLAERGVPGLLALLAVFGSAIWRSGRLWCRSPSMSWRCLAGGILAALGVMMAAGVAEASLTRLWVTVLLLALLGFSQVLPDPGAVVEGR